MKTYRYDTRGDDARTGAVVSIVRMRPAWWCSCAVIVRDVDTGAEWQTCKCTLLAL